MTSKYRLKALERCRRSEAGGKYGDRTPAQWLAFFAELAGVPELAAEPMYAEELERLRWGSRRIGTTSSTPP